jgi:hypothetical protein
MNYTTNNTCCSFCQQPKKHSDTRPTHPSTWSKTCGAKSCIKQLTQQTNIAEYGHPSNLHATQPNGKTVLQNSIQQKYNVDNISQIASVKLKKQSTCLENFGVAWPMQSSIVRAKSIGTALTKYGYDNVSKSPVIIEKIKQTHLDRYGSFYMQTTEGKELLKSICQEKHGVDWYFSSTEFKQKLETRCLELYGVTNPFFSPVVQSLIAKRNSKGKSNEETVWLDSLNISADFRQHNIKSISGKNYIVDGFDADTNTVYEWNGSFWHGNPDYYEATTAHPVISNTTFGELYNQTIRKQQDLLDSGYNLIVKWSTV